ncbi:MAG: P1 family peptidase [Acidimicrobiia bacterium]|nr:P1 family peptidase [Acidimicrobiia bacterium]
MVSNQTITAVPGVLVGHWTDLDAATGVTVIDLPEPNLAAFEARGGAPGTRETALLAPSMKLETIQSIVFSGGSAFGLATADGVMRELAADGRGHPTPAGPVPIVPAAILYDLFVGENKPPTAEAGAAAYRARTADPVALGSVGAGTGATVSKWSGFEKMRKAGIGSAATRVGTASLGVLAAVNAVGDVVDLRGNWLTGGPTLQPPEVSGSRQNTTLVAVATDAALSKSDLLRLIVRSHDALAATLRPAHTRYDGDIVFAVSCGEEAVDMDLLGEVTFNTTAAAIVSSVTSATSLAGIPAVDDD